MAGDLNHIRIPNAIESERATASIALTYPEEFVAVSSEHRFNLNDMFDPVCKAVVQSMYELACGGKSSDIRIVFDRVKKEIPPVEFYQISDLYTLGIPKVTLVDHLNIIRMTAKRRSLISLLVDTTAAVADTKIETAHLLADLNSKVDKLASEAVSTRAPKINQIALAAVNRYQTGEDKSQRVMTGFRSVDEMTPIQFGDFMVIGGETKAGKTALALNIIANIIKAL